MRMVDSVKELATKKGCMPGQLALAWVHAQGPDVFPIPGTKRIKYLEVRRVLWLLTNTYCRKPGCWDYNCSWQRP